MLTRESIGALKEEIKQKRTVVYELDLKNSIEEEKSAASEVKQTAEYWEFVCERGAEIPFSNFEVIFGELAEKDGYPQGKIKKLPYRQNNKLFSAIAALNKEYDILNIEFQGKSGQYFQALVFSEYLYQMKKELKESNFTDGKTAALYLNKLDSLQVETIFNIDASNKVTIFNNSRLVAWRAFKYTCEDKVSFYLDYKLAKININQENWRQVNNIELNEPDYLEMRANVNEDFLINDVFDIYKVTYARNKGYVYLKPIGLPKGNYQFFLYHTGEIDVEYCQSDGQNWLGLDGEIYLSAQEELMLRLKMNSGSKLYDLLIAE